MESKILNEDEISKKASEFRKKKLEEGIGEFDEEFSAKEAKRLLNSMELKVHPGGCVKEIIDGDVKHRLVVEPIDSHEYVFKFLGKKGSAKVELNLENKKYYLEILGVGFELEDKPLDSDILSIMKIPDKDKVKKWINGKYDSLTTQELYDKMLLYFKFFSDLSEEAYYHLLIMTVFQSWMVELLKAVWYVTITGSFGGGKSSTLEACVSVCKHGCIVGDSTISFLCRSLDKLKTTPFLDEFDSIAGEEDSEYYAIIRQGQKQGQPFARMGEKGEVFNIFKVFGVKLISVHGQLEDALQSRSFIINTSESDDPNISYTKNVLDAWSDPLYTDLFLWYLDTINHVDIIDTTKVLQSIYDSYTNTVDVKAARKLLVDGMPHGALGSKHTGRDAELEGVWMSISSILGLSELVDDSVARLIDLKNDVRDETRETGMNGLLRDYLVKYYRDNRNNDKYFTKDGLFFMCSHKDISEGFRAYCKSKGEYNVTKGGFSGSLKELGFTQGKNKKKTNVWDQGDGDSHVRTALVFDERVQKLMGLKIEPYAGVLNQSSVKDSKFGDEE